MMSNVVGEFEQTMKRTLNLIHAGYIKNQDEIKDILIELALSGLAIRYFVQTSIKNPQKRGVIGDNSFMVYACPEFSLRFNLWHPIDSLATHMQLDDIERYYDVDDTHNHNYDFFTVGVAGPGYCSEFLITDKVTEWEIGDIVEFNDEFEITLAKGVCLFVPKDTHFHTQFAPNKLSVSLNIIPNPEFSSFGYTLTEDKMTVSAKFASNKNILTEKRHELQKMAKENVRAMLLNKYMSNVETGQAKEMLDRFLTSSQ